MTLASARLEPHIGRANQACAAANRGDYHSEAYRQQLVERSWWIYVLDCHRNHLNGLPPPKPRRVGGVA